MDKVNYKVEFEFTIPMSDAFKNLFEDCGLGGGGDVLVFVYDLEKNVLVGRTGYTAYEYQKDKNTNDYDDLPF